MENHHRILHIQIGLGSKFHLQQFCFLEQICPKKESFRSKIEKMNVIIESFILELVQVPNFSLN